MQQKHFLPDEISEVKPKTSDWQRFRRVFFGRKVVLFGIIVLVFYMTLKFPLLDSTN